MKNKGKVINKLRRRRKERVRARLSGTAIRPRLAIYRSLKHLSVQAIDDTVGKTLLSVYDGEVKAKDRRNQAKAIGLLLAKKLLEEKINQAVFDKRHYKYHGLIKEVAEGVREGGIKM